MTTVSINGTGIYHEIHGSGEPVLLLHGGFCSIEMMRPQIGALASRYTVYAPERPGHGRSPDVPGPISYAQSVADTLDYLDAVGVQRPHIVGFSDGAIIGLTIALQYPDRIRSLVAISGNLDPSGFVDELLGDDLADDASDDSAAETLSDIADSAALADDTEYSASSADESDSEIALDPTRVAYNALSPHGPEHADVVLDKLRYLWTHEPNIAADELAGISVPVLIIAGDRDVIKLEHSRQMAFMVPDGQLCIVPRASHALLDERPEFITFAVQDFLAGLPTV